MLKSLLASVWRRTPRRLRRLGVRLTQSRFTVTAGAVVTDAGGRVLLLKHVFRSGSGWGVPGGFLEPGEQPEEGIRRELREEAGLEVEEVCIIDARSFRRPQQVEILFRARAAGAGVARAASVEVSRAAWFAPDELPPELPADQRRLIERALKNGAPVGE
ncbi:MAG: NUDIX domain-containing protein [Acidobacteria bacterium]|nr:NUDIX domain-containing protein [Acidobacteriota bacterium]